MERKEFFEEMAKQTDNLIDAVSSLKNDYYVTLLNLFLGDDYLEKKVDLSFINDSIVQVGKIEVQLECIRSKIDIHIDDELPFD